MQQSEKPVLFDGAQEFSALTQSDPTPLAAPVDGERQKPIAHLVWLQGRRAADDVEDYYEVARPGDKCVDGSDPFPVYTSPLPSGTVGEPVGVKTVSNVSGIADRIRATTEEMANVASVDMGLWNRHSNACLDAAIELERMGKAVDFSKLYTHPLAKLFHEVIQAVDNLGCDSTSAVDDLHVLATAVELEINRLSAHLEGDVTDDMLNEGQERMCQMSSRTFFEDHIQAEIYKAMRNAEHQARVDQFSVIGSDWAEPGYGSKSPSTALPPPSEPAPQVVGSEVAKAASLGAAVLARIEDPAAREIAIRNALTVASTTLSTDAVGKEG